MICTNVSNQTISQVFEFIPETKGIEEYACNFVASIQGDNKLPDASTFFSQVISDNKDVFQNKIEEQKSHALFEVYKKLIISNLKKKSEFAHSFSILEKACVGKLPKETPLAELVDEFINQKMDRFYTNFPLFAIKTALGIEVSKINLPVKDLENPIPWENLVVSNDAQELFKKIIKV